MKRSTMLALTGVMTMFLGACGDNTPPKPVAVTTTTTTSTTAPATDEGKQAEQPPAPADQRAEADVGPLAPYGAAMGDAGSNDAPTGVEDPAENAQTAPSEEDAPAPAEPPAA